MAYKLIQAMSQSYDFSSIQTTIILRPTLNIMPATYAYDYDLYLISSCQHFDSLLAILQVLNQKAWTTIN